MNYEIEAKLKVDSFDSVNKRLVECGADFIERRIQSDDYFDTPDRRLIESHSGLRIRRQKTEDGEKCWMTWKGNPQPGPFKHKAELEVELGNGCQLIDQILNGLGFVSTLTVEKKRQLWQLAGCEVSLDTVEGLGNFVEIEGPDVDTVEKVRKLLGLDVIEHTPHSYAAMLAGNG